jgi:hypothetical protein
MTTKNWEETATQKRKKQAEDIAAFASAELSDADQRREYYSSITEIDNITLLAEKIVQNEYSSEDVAKAYISR